MLVAKHEELHFSDCVASVVYQAALGNCGERRVEGQRGALDIVLVHVNCLHYATTWLEFVARENALRSRRFIVYLGEVKDGDIYNSSPLLRADPVRRFLKLVHVKNHELKPITAVSNAVETDFYAKFVNSLGCSPASPNRIKVNERRYGAFNVLDAISEEIPAWQDDVVD